MLHRLGILSKPKVSTTPTSDLSNENDERFSIKSLRNLYSQLVENKDASDAQGIDVVVRVLQEISEMVVYGDSKNELLFDFFCEKNMLALFVDITKSTFNEISKVHIQILQTLCILIESVKQDTSIYYLLSNHHINHIILFRFDWSTEDLLNHYITLLKTLSLRLNSRTAQFFFIQESNAFPLLSQAIHFLSSSTDQMIRTAAQNIILNIFSVQDNIMLKYALQADFLDRLCATIVELLGSQFLTYLNLTSQISGSIAQDDDSKYMTRTAWTEFEDTCYFINDLTFLFRKDEENTSACTRYLVESLVRNIIVHFIYPSILDMLTYRKVVTKETDLPVVHEELSHKVPNDDSNPSNSILLSISCKSLSKEEGPTKINSRAAILAIYVLNQMVKIIKSEVWKRAVIIALLHPSSRKLRKAVLGNGGCYPIDSSSPYCPNLDDTTTTASPNISKINSSFSIDNMATVASIDTDHNMYRQNYLNILFLTCNQTKWDTTAKALVQISTELLVTLTIVLNNDLLISSEFEESENIKDYSLTIPISLSTVATNGNFPLLQVLFSSVLIWPKLENNQTTEEVKDGKSSEKAFARASYASVTKSVGEVESEDYDLDRPWKQVKLLNDSLHKSRTGFLSILPGQSDLGLLFLDPDIIDDDRLILLSSMTTNAIRGDEDPYVLSYLNSNNKSICQSLQCIIVDIAQSLNMSHPVSVWDASVLKIRCQALLGLLRQALVCGCCRLSDRNGYKCILTQVSSVEALLANTLLTLDSDDKSEQLTDLLLKSVVCDERIYENWPDNQTVEPPFDLQVYLSVACESSEVSKESFVEDEFMWPEVQCFFIIKSFKKAVEILYSDFLFDSLEGKDEAVVPMDTQSEHQQLQQRKRRSSISSPVSDGSHTGGPVIEGDVVSLSGKTSIVCCSVLSPAEPTTPTPITNGSSSSIANMMRRFSLYHSTPLNQAHSPPSPAVSVPETAGDKPTALHEDVFLILDRDQLLLVKQDYAQLETGVVLIVASVMDIEASIDPAEPCVLLLVTCTLAANKKGAPTVLSSSGSGSSIEGTVSRLRFVCAESCTLVAEMLDNSRRNARKEAHQLTRAMLRTSASQEKILNSVT